MVSRRWAQELPRWVPTWAAHAISGFWFRAYLTVRNRRCRDAGHQPLVRHPYFTIPTWECACGHVSEYDYDGTYWRSEGDHHWPVTV